MFDSLAPILIGASLVILLPTSVFIANLIGKALLWAIDKYTD